MIFNLLIPSGTTIIAGHYATKEKVKFCYFNVDMQKKFIFEW